MTPRRALVVQSRRPLKVPMGHTSGALAPRNSAGCVRRRLDVIFLFTFDPEWSDPTPVGCHVFVPPRLRAKVGFHDVYSARSAIFVDY
jgi:hypothetical protein